VKSDLSGISNYAFNKQPSQDLKWYLTRQLSCFSSCLKHHRDHNRSWTMLIDIDEYLTFNSISNRETVVADGKRIDLFSKDMNKTDKYNFFPEKFKMHNKILVDSVVGGGNKEKFIITGNVIELLKGRTRLPSFLGYKTIGEFIWEESKRFPWNSNSCIVSPWLQFGSSDELNQKILSRGLPNNITFDEKRRFSRMNTIRFFWHGKRGGHKSSLGKSLVDVSRISLPILIRNPHSVVKECGLSYKASSFPLHATALLRVNHYSMSKEAFFAKSDCRRTSKLSNAKLVQFLCSKSWCY